MCGIAGIISLKYSINDNDCKLLLNCLKRVKHRGPDEEGIYYNNDLCMGSARLSIIGESQGKQPLQENNGALIFNGEIYNFQQVSNNNKCSSDTKVLFDLLSKRGIGILNELNGMFAFCFVDTKNIYLVRDRFGEKPLYYTFNNNKLFFSSEIKSFLEIIKLQLSLPAYYPLLETVIGKDTIFKDVFQLEPGHFLKVSRGNKRVEKIKYYQPNIARSESTFNEAKLQLRYLLDDAIKIRTPRHIDFAAYISGGIDSSIIALSSHPQMLLSFIAKGNKTKSEEKYSDILAEKLHIKYQKVSSNFSDFPKYLYDIIYALDGPTTSLAALSQFLLSQRVHKEGYRITISGLGADEFFNGYVRHAFALFDTNFPEFDSYKELYKKIGNTINLTSRYSKLLNRSNEHSPERIEKLIESFFKNNHSASAIALSDSICTLPSLLTMDDHINMAFAIESRNPFLDHRIVEFALSLEDLYKIRLEKKEISLKYILRQAYDDLLPETIRNRKDKIGFPSLVNEWLSHELAFLVEKSQQVLQEAFPCERYFFSENKNLLYDRRKYQWVQLAATYLIYCERYNKETFNKFYRKEI